MKTRDDSSAQTRKTNNDPRSCRTISLLKLYV